MKFLAGPLVFILMAADVSFSYVNPKQPLPLITKVNYNTMQSEDSTGITVWYLCKERPHMEWYVDGMPFAPDNMVFQLNHFEYTGYAILQTSRDKGRRFSLCLVASEGQACVQLRPLPDGQEGEEVVEFSWPLIVPAPIARYHMGKKSKMFLPELATNHSYEYSAMFIAHDPQGHLVQGKSKGLEGGEEGDLVTIKPATFGEGGWMLYANTDVHSYEGVLIINTTYRPAEGLVESCTLSRPMEIYVRGHDGPFEPNFVAMVPRDNPASPRRCRQHIDCIITCPVIANATYVTVELTSIGGTARKEITGEVWKLGPYYGKARFVLSNFNSGVDSGPYMCSVSSETMTATDTVIIH